MHAKNLVTVGDFVRFEPSSEKEGIISQIEDRFSMLARTDISGKKEQLIAANIDQVFIIISVVEPELKPALVDRYLIAALMAQGMTPWAAAALGTHLHSLAGDRWLQTRGPSGMTARELLMLIPGAFEDCRQGE